MYAAGTGRPLRHRDAVSVWSLERRIKHAGNAVRRDKSGAKRISARRIRCGAPRLPRLPRTTISLVTKRPGPYSIRRYLPGDEEAWQRIHEAADAYLTYPDFRFVEQFGADEDLLRENQYYLCEVSGRPVGTATTW